MNSPLRSTVALVTLLLTFSSARAAVTLPPLFSDHMLLQRNTDVPIWGKALPGEKVTIEFASKSAAATADDKGEWLAKLPPLKPGDATTLTVKSDKGDPIVLNDVLVGDVWICSGQSNMQFGLRSANNGAAEVKNAANPNLRLFKFARTVSVEPSKDIKGNWSTCTPESARMFSAVGYFFGREIAKGENVPVGLIENSWGGMPAEAFTSRETLESDPDLRPLVELKEQARQGAAEKKAAHDKAVQEWEKKYTVKDPGNEGEKKGWAKADFDDSDWKTMPEPCKWETKGLLINGAVWFRKTIDVPADWEGKALALSLGILDDFDTTYFNGQKVGSIGEDNILAWAAERKYTVSPELAKAGKATIAVRIFDKQHEGGFSGPEDALELSLKGTENDPNAKSISLAGDWKYKVEYEVKQPDKLPPLPPAGFSVDSPSAASNLYNGMVFPLIPYAIKGAIWYQGESNAPRAEQYRKLFPAMIQDWRKNWGQGDEPFPFLFVQLANYANGKPIPKDPDDSTWAELREAQTQTLKKVPNTGMAVTIDIGDANNIHPTNKQDVGKRLALAAEKIVYGKETEYCGPMYESMKIENQTSGDVVRIKFSHADGLKTSDGGLPKGFSISSAVGETPLAGEDNKFVWANARIEGDEVVVWSKHVKKPIAVRYAWADNPECNLVNSAGLPASPFRTDDFPGVTSGVLTPTGKKKR